MHTLHSASYGLKTKQKSFIKIAWYHLHLAHQCHAKVLISHNAVLGPPWRLLTLSLMHGLDVAGACDEHGFIFELPLFALRKTTPKTVRPGGSGVPWCPSSRTSFHHHRRALGLLTDLLDPVASSPHILYFHSEGNP